MTTKIMDHHHHHQMQTNNKVLTIREEKFMKKIPLLNDMPRKALTKENKRTFKNVFNKIRLRKCASATISKPFPTYHVAYLGNVITGWAKGDGCIEKPLATLWRNYIQSSRPDVNMHLTVSGGGLKAVTKNHGLTEYWAHRLTTCAAPEEFPRIFCWIYRHEGRRLRHELRCHAALCSSTDMARQIHKELKEFLLQALTDFKKEKLSRQNARLSLVNSVQENPSLPRRKILLGTGTHNYRPPLECSKSAPKLSSIEEMYGEEEDDGDLLRRTQQIYRNILKSYEKAANYLFERDTYWPYYKKKQAIRWSNRSNNKNHCDIRQNNYKDVDSKNIENELTSVETEEDKCDIKNNNCSMRTEAENNKLTQDPILATIEETLENKKLDLDFKIGGEVLPALKIPDKPNIDHPFVITKGFIDQEKVSLVPVGESHSDFSSLKVYKKRSFNDGNNKDFAACAMFLGESLGQLEHIFQSHCSFSGGDRSEDEITSKMNSTLLV
ncbi:unnamed protein product [Ceutorhynchus assimilis]|uniref:PID domain-containing protein n=1 Tax=Ceutorhynchus assimilis TaxID=467358 RepID=A0A9P0DE53_9CUCU|nr:unnamed protein product [Ceutorhynchus assimilis]